MQMIKTRAAVAWGPNQPLSVTKVDLMPPQKGEVLVRIVASGVCHTDAYTLSGKDPEGVFPAILGHEGGGVVEALGEGVTSVAVGMGPSSRYIRRSAASANFAAPAKPIYVRLSALPRVKD